MTKNAEKKEWCIVFDLRHYTKPQVFELGCFTGGYDQLILHDGRIAITTKSWDEALVRVKEIDGKLVWCNPPYHFFYALVPHDEIKEEEDFWRNEKHKHARAKLYRDREVDAQARALMAERESFK